MLAAFVLTAVACNKTHVSKEVVGQGTLVMLHSCVEPLPNEPNVTVCYEELLADSRCPEDVVCIWAGSAVARFTLTKNGQEFPFTLATLQYANFQHSIDVEGYRIELLDLFPHSTTTHTPTPPSFYKADIRVTKL